MSIDDREIGCDPLLKQAVSHNIPDGIYLLPPDKRNYVRDIGIKNSKRDFEKFSLLPRKDKHLPDLQRVFPRELDIHFFGDFRPFRVNNNQVTCPVGTQVS
jgi:hypothetical protein